VRQVSGTAGTQSAVLAAVLEHRRKHHIDPGCADLCSRITQFVCPGTCSDVGLLQQFPWRRIGRIHETVSREPPEHNRPVSGAPKRRETRLTGGRRTFENCGHEKRARDSVKYASPEDGFESASRVALRVAILIDTSVPRGVDFNRSNPRTINSMRPR
jgi:hypothetical protein